MATVQERHPEIYIEANENPRTRKRTVPMEVLSLGYSRTGTMTIKAALEILGIPTWHWVTMSTNPPDLVMWSEALESKFEPGKHVSPLPLDRTTFDHLLGSWGACTDQPAAIFADELVQAYPEAKVVLVERDVDRWYKSFSETVINGIIDPFIPFASLIDPGYMGQMARQTDLIAKHYFHIPYPRQKNLMVQKDFGETFRATAKDVYLAHNEMVKRVTPRERLLILKLGEWEPLCKFLGKPIPDVPFPRVNETAVVQEKIQMYIAESYRRSFVRFAKKAIPVVVAVAGAIIWWVWYR